MNICKQSAYHGRFYFALNGQSAAKPRIEEGSTTISEMGVGTSVPKWRTPKLNTSMVNDIVYTLMKVKENLL